MGAKFFTLAFFLYLFFFLIFSASDALLRKHYLCKAGGVYIMRTSLEHKEIVASQQKGAKLAHFFFITLLYHLACTGKAKAFYFITKAAR